MLLYNYTFFNIILFSYQHLRYYGNNKRLIKYLCIVDDCFIFQTYILHLKFKIKATFKKYYYCMQ